MLSTPDTTKSQTRSRSSSAERRNHAEADKHSKRDKRGELREFSVVYTDRALNHMSETFQTVMTELHGVLVEAYAAKRAVLLPGSGTFAMEAVARQLIPLDGSKRPPMVLRNGYFSFRWTDIFEHIGVKHTVLKGVPMEADTDHGYPKTDGDQPHFMPHPLEGVLAAIAAEKPSVLFAPHIETSTGILLSDSYIKALSQAMHDIGGVFVLDGIAAGFHWVNMRETGVDFYLSAPQKGWTGPAGVGVVMMSDNGYDVMSKTTSSSMALNLRKWRDVMEAYLDGGNMYYTTMPTDSIRTFRDFALETKAYGFEKIKAEFAMQGEAVAELLESRGFKVVAAPGHRSPGVVVAYTKDATMLNRFKAEGIQVAGYVPFKIDEPEGIKTFRLGLFGLDKITEGQKTLGHLERALNGVLASRL